MAECLNGADLFSRRLTAHVKAGGCASKLSPKLLERALSAIPRTHDPNVLVGFDTADDAAVYRLAPDLALVHTIDFFTPVVDDPFTFGAIAAANALSDIYAMGGTPLSALSVVAFPAAEDIAVLGEILRGGAEKMRAAGCPVVGGHSVNDGEVKFGYAVTGRVHPERIKANAGARAGDALVFTKALGTGVIATAMKRGAATPDAERAATASMLRLNREACDVMLRHNANGCTDVTGFGLAAHAREMAVASGVTLAIEAARIPLLAGAREAVAAGFIPAGLHNNREFAECVLEIRTPPDPITYQLLFDPQTSGGLLVSIPEGGAEAMIREFPEARRIGSVQPRGAKPVRLV